MGKVQAPAYIPGCEFESTIVVVAEKPMERLDEEQAVSFVLVRTGTTSLVFLFIDTQES